MSTKFDAHTAKFLSAVAQNMPKDMSGDIMQGWIDNPIALQRVLRSALCPLMPDQALSAMLRPIVSCTISAVDGTETILNGMELDIRRGIEGALQRYCVDKIIAATPDTPVTVYEMVKEATFEQMFGSLSQETDRLCLTHSQIIRFCIDHRQHLHTHRYETFFLFKSNGKFFVTSVYSGGNHLGAHVYQFESDAVWAAKNRRRVVVPQLGRLAS